jgi:hypothetical protein
MSEQRDERATVTAGQASRLLDLGVAGPRRPIDDVIYRLQQDDGGSWFTDCVLSLMGMTPDAGSDTGLDTLEQARDRAKEAMAAAATCDAAAAATAAYFVAIGAALAWHDKLVSTQPAEELRPVLADLAAVVPEPWPEVLMAAAWRLQPK